MQKPTVAEVYEAAKQILRNRRKNETGVVRKVFQKVEIFAEESGIVAWTNSEIFQHLPAEILNNIEEEAVRLPDSAKVEEIGKGHYRLTW